MKKQFKVILACGVLSMASVAVSTALLSNPTSASATTGFAMEYGARIRIGGTNDSHNGIRFTADLGTDLSVYNADAKWYVMVVPASYVEGMEGENIDYYQEIYDDLYNAETNANPYIATMQAEPYQVEGNYYVQGSLVNIKYENINRDWFGVAYYEVNGVRTYATFNEGENVRNVVEMASDYINQGKTEKEYQDYVKQGFNQASGNEENAEVSYNEVIDNLSLSASTLTLNDLAKGELTVEGLPEGMKVDVEWSVDSDSDIATVVNGVVTPTAYGETTVTAKVLGQTLTCTLTSVKTTFDMNAFEIEVSAGTALTMTQTIDGDITSATIGEKAVEASYADGTITIANAQFASVYGEQNVVVKTNAGKTYQAKGLFITDVINSTTDLKNAYKYVRGDGSLNGGGYFILGKDIIFEDASNVNFMNAESWGTADVKFNGTLDGRGHKIDGMYVQIYNNGLLGCTSKATLKNIAFTNGKTTRSSDGGSNAFLMTEYNETVGISSLENVYVHMAVQSTPIVGRHSVKTDNVMFVIDSTDGYNYKAYNQDAYLTSGETVKIGGNGAETKVSYYATITEAAAFNFSTWDTSFWNVNGKVAYPNKLTVPEVTLTVDKQTTDVNTTVNAITDKTSVLSLNKEALDAGITLVDGVVTIPNDEALLGTSFTITATSVYDSSKTVVKPVYIASITNTKLSLGDKDMTTTTALTVSVGEVRGALASVKLGDKDVTANATYADGVVSIPVEQATDWGEKTVEVVFKQMNGGTLASQTTITADVVLVTMYIGQESTDTSIPVATWTALYNKVQEMQGYGYYKQTSDITFKGMGGFNFRNANTDTNKYFGLGTDTNKFKGTYDGWGYKLSGAWVMRFQHGVFGKVDGATIKNVVALDLTIGSDNSNADAGLLYGAATVKNVYVEVKSVVGTGNKVFAGSANNYTNVLVVYNCTTDASTASNLDASNKLQIVQIGGASNTKVSYYADKTAAAAAEAAAKHNYSTWDTSFWTVVNGVPTPKCLVS